MIVLKHAWSSILVTVKMRDRDDVVRLLEAISEVSPEEYIRIATLVASQRKPSSRHPSRSAIGIRRRDDPDARLDRALRAANLVRERRNVEALRQSPILRRLASSLLSAGIRAASRSVDLLCYWQALVAPESIVGVDRSSENSLHNV
jgi:hypothetical protein